VRALATTSRAGLVVANLMVAALYAGLGAAAGMFFARFGLFPSPIWLPAGLAAVAYLVGGTRLVPGLFLGALAVNHLLLAAPLATASLIAATNSLGPLAGAWLTRRMRPPTGLFTRLSGVLGFVAGSVLLHAGITSGGGTLALILLGGLPVEAAYPVAANWLLSDAGGVFFLAPALMLWLGTERTPPSPGPAIRRRDLLGMAATALVAALVFALPPPHAALVQPEAVFLLTIPITWITLRISLRAAYTLLSLISVVATVGTLAGLGPFQPDLVPNPLRAVGMMIVLMATNALALMALLSERREAEAWLAGSNTRLVAEVAARTAELRHRAETDDLTGIGNRGSFLRRLDAALADARRDGTALAMLVVDIDHFRPLNDMRGHAAGDLALREVASLCAAQMEGVGRHPRPPGWGGLRRRAARFGASRGDLSRRGACAPPSPATASASRVIRCRRG
jgi:integral membrane sensor domain MASE1